MRNPKDRFYHDAAQLSLLTFRCRWFRVLKISHISCILEGILQRNGLACNVVTILRCR